MKALHMVTFLLLVVGGINWLLVGIFGWDIGVLLFGGMDQMMSKIIYLLVGASALIVLFTHKKDCKMCAKSSTMPMGSGMGGGMPS